MGNCLQNLFRSHRSSLKHESLLNFRQLTTMIKSSTYNDNMFYSSSNLTAIEQFLNQFTLKPETPLNHDFINQNINILQQFIQNLRDRSSSVGKQFVNDQQRVYKYLQQQKIKGASEQTKLSDLVILRIQIQVLLLGINICEFTQSNSEWELLLQIYEDPTDGMRSTIKSTGYNISQQISEHFELLDRIFVPNQQSIPHQMSEHCKQNVTMSNPLHGFKKNNGLQPNFNPRNQTVSNIKQNSLAEDPHLNKRQQYQKDVGQLQEFKLFSFTSKVVKRQSKLNFNLFKLKKKKGESPSKHMSNTIYISKNKVKNTHSKNKTLLACTSLSVSDFIYYNSLMISDVIPLNSPTSASHIKSSITTTASNMNNSNTVAFVSLRGQGLQAITLQKDYLRIIKQHQIVVRQLQICLEGDKSWQKLSEFRHSSESHPEQSLYSEYSVPQQGVQRYKL